MTTLVQPQIHEIEFKVKALKYWSDETGYAVINAINSNKRELTVTGYPGYACHPGERIFCSGEMVNHPTYGPQLVCSSIRVALPNTKSGIIKFLQSSKLKGIGKGFAEKIYDHFEHDVFNVLREEPARFLEIEGLGKKRLDQLRSSWLENQSLHEMTCFLQSHGLGTIRSEKIFRYYGDQAIKVIRNNPFQLVEDIPGLGFKIADQLAQSLGLDPQSNERLHAGVKFCLDQGSHSGHTYLTLEELSDQVADLLKLDSDVARNFLSKQQDSELYRLLADRICLESLFQAEKYCSEKIKQKLLTQYNNNTLSERRLVVEDFLKTAQDQLTHEQIAAIQMAIEHPISILTGGPGVGKTTTVRAILRCFESMNLKVMLAAPTGRAAKRLEESTSRSAKTIHRTLDYDPVTGSFKHNEHNHLKADFIIIDEMSMVDINLFNQLLKAISMQTGILFVGDPDQLPSVGPGAVLRDCLSYRAFPQIHLTQIFRQASQSLIVKNAYRVKTGKFPIKATEGTDFLTHYVDTQAEGQCRVLDVVSSLLIEGYDLFKDIQILTPMHKGELGTVELNKKIQKAHCQSGHTVQRNHNTFHKGDKVIQLSNDYDKGVFNGDIGWIDFIDDAQQNLQVVFNGKSVIYLFDELDQLQLAYATSIHKSQGSEYPVVILCLSTSHYMLLSRKLVYTAITRAKKQLIMIAQPRSIALTISKNKLDERQTHLGEWLCQS